VLFQFLNKKDKGNTVQYKVSETLIVPLTLKYYAPGFQLPLKDEVSYIMIHSAKVT